MADNPAFQANIVYKYSWFIKIIFNFAAKVLLFVDMCNSLYYFYVFFTKKIQVCYHNYNIARKKSNPEGLLSPYLTSWAADGIFMVANCDLET